MLASGAGEDIGTMNALDALGIDTSIMPEGYDEHSTDNPYGRNIVTVAPVHELFVTGKANGDSVTEAVYGEMFTVTEAFYRYPLDTVTEAVYGETVDTVTEAVYGDSADTVTEAVYGEPMFTVMEAVNGETPWENTLYGHNKPLYRLDEHGQEHNDMDFFYNEGQSISVTMLQPIAATATASGNFIGEGIDGSAAGKTEQVVAVGAGSLDKNGGLYLYFTDPVTGAMSSQMKTLLNNDRIIGNTGNQMDEDFEECPYLMQNYLQIATGDFDNNGIDEIAAYVAEQGNSRVEIYKLHTTAAYDDDFYLDPDNWKKEWTYYFNEEPYVSNMVSLTSGDFNQDGIDDLALTWGYYYGPEENSGCQAVVMYGGKTNMLQEKKEIDLFFDTAKIVRASFASGDITGDGVPELILGGQLDNDIKDGNLSTRFIAIYTYDGGNDCFVQTTAKNFDLFEKDEHNSYTYPAMADQDDKYHSVPGSPANIAVVKIEGVGELSYIYLDSILYEFEDKHLDIVMALDNHQDFNKYKDTVRAYYVEYGVVAADFTGDGRETLQLMQYYVPVEEIETVQEIRFKWWFITIYGDVEITVPHPGELNMLGIYESDASFQVRRTEGIDFTTSFCKLDTDNDTMLLRYTGEKYIEYTDPEVLAVLASPPYFADLSNDALSGSYMSSETSYQESSGTGGGSFISYTITLGAYVSFEQEVSFWGIKAAKCEAEQVFKGGFTYEIQEKSMLEQSVSYSAPAGSDSVAFFSIPMEKYIYESETPIIDEDTGEILGTEKQLMTVNIPHTAAVQVLPLETYEKVSADYSELPQISGAILTHTVGDPTTYPSNTFGFKKPLVYSGDWSMVNYGGGSVSQEIAMSDEAEQSYKGTAAVEFKIGAGAGGVVVGIVGGYEFGGGLVTISTSGSSFAGQIYNMPVEAEPYNYSYKWKLFSYEYSSGGNTFPVVSYLLTEVIAPPKLPTDFQQDMEGTTDEKIKLTWSYPIDTPVAGFQLYRYYEFPDGSGSYELAFVPASEHVRVDEGTRYYEYVDTGLYSYTDYAYQVQTIGALQPTDSIFSQVYTFRTKTDEGYPDISLQGPAEGKLLVYPDTERTVSVDINNMEDYTQTPKCQWQKLTEEGWVNITGATGASYTFRSAGLADEGNYRCRVNAIYKNYLISDYSEVFTLEYRKRTPRVVDGSFIVRDIDGDIEDGAEIQISLKSAHADHYYPPSGNVVFEVNGPDYKRSFTVELEESGLAGEAIATVTLDNPLPDGAYLITAYYSGSRVYQALTCEEAVPYLSGGESGFVLIFDSSYTYGDDIELSLSELEKNNGITAAVPITGDVVCEVVQYSWEPAEGGRLERSFEIIEEFITSEGNVTAAQAGKFTLVAYLNGDEVASREFTVAQREITIGIEDQEAIAFAPNLTHPDSSILKVHPDTPLAYEDTLNDMGLAVRATNTAGTEVTIGSETDPGVYTIAGRAAEEAGAKYDNYHISYISGTYTLTGPKYNVAGVAELLNNKTVGTIELVVPDGYDDWPEEDSYVSHGTGLVFLAKPYAGYDVSRWSITNADTGDEIVSSGSNLRLNYQMTAENIRVTVEFQVAQNRLYYMTSGGAGELVCTSDTVIQSGAVAMSGAEFTFQATPAEGYHFVEWQLHEIGKSPTIPTGSLYPDGSSNCEITMGSSNTWLYAIFARDCYELTLQGDLQATYLVDPDIAGEDPEMVTVFSGAKIKGDTEVTVMPRPGFSVERDAVWRQDGMPVSADQGSDNQNYTFTMLADTEISVQTENEYYDVTLEVEGPGDSENAVSVTINGNVADTGNLSHIAGGSSLVFTPLPAYGYVFHEWIVNGEPISGSTLHVAALGGELAVKAVFKDNTAYTISLIHGLRGMVSYTLNGGEPSTVTSGGKIPVFKGDEVVLTAMPEVNFMVEYWKIDGIVKQTTARTQTFEDISADIDIEVVFGAQTYSTVTYTAGEGGAIISAKSDGISFASGSNSIGNGTTLEFTAAPDNGMMVKYWKLNGAVVKNDFGGTLVDTTYTVSALSGDAHIEVSFKELLTHDVEVQNTNTGTYFQYYPDFGIEDEVLDGAMAVFTIKPDSGYQIISVGVTGNAGKEGLNGFDSITKKADGTWICVVGAATADLTVTAVASKLYSITIPTIPVGGSITVSTDRAIEGEAITLTATPASANYVFDSWTVEPEDAGVKIEVDDLGAANTHFTMPASNVSVTAAFKYVPSPSPKPSPGGGGRAPIRIVSEEGLLPLRLGSVTLQLPCTINNAAVSFILDDSIMEEILSLSSETEITIDLSGLEGINSIECGLDGKWLVGDGHISALTLIGLGEVTISGEMLKSFGVNQDSMVKIRIELGSITVSVELNGRAIEGSNPFHPIRVVYPYNSFRNDITIIYDTKTGSIVPFSLFDGKGNIIFFTPYFGTFEARNNEKVFHDIAGHWAAGNIAFTAARELFAGTSATEFSPNVPMTRAMFVTVLGRLLNIDEASYTGTSYPDVTAGQWYSPYVQWAAENDIVKGYGSGLFGPGDNITREQMAVIILSFAAYANLELAAESSEVIFKDKAEISSWAIEHVLNAQRFSLIEGKGNGFFDPRGTATRAEVATILKRFIENVVRPRDNETL